MSNETEEQQIAALKKWWGENATSIIFGIALGLAGLFGSKAWLGYQAGLSEQAATVYTVMMQGLDVSDRQRVSKQADILITQFGSTPYASLAALALAKIKMQDGDLVAANSQLQWVLDNGDVDVINDTARLRLARVLIAQQRLDEAEALVNQPRSTTAFDSLYDELAGDIYAVRDNTVAAHEAYQRALAGTPSTSPVYQMLKLKYENVMVANKVINEVSP